jgi:hypothetical protein
LQEIDPTLVKFVVDETEKEAAHRRKQESRLNTFVFIERMSGVVIAGLVTVFVFAIGGFLVYKGHDWAGTVLCGAGLSSIVALFVNRQKNVTEQARVKAAAPAKPRAPRQKKQLPK